MDRIDKKEARNLFYSLTNINIKSIEEIYSGFSNQNFLINDAYVLRIPLPNKDESINYYIEEETYNLIKDLNFSEKIIYFSSDSGIKISKFIHNAKSYSSTPSDLEIKNVAKLLKKLHKSNIKCSRSYDMFNRLSLYKSKVEEKDFILKTYEDNIVNKVKEIYSKLEECLCHNDVVKGNLLFGYSKTYLIDWEYGANNNPYFDLASFISENNLNPNQEELFLKTYFGSKLTNLNKKRISLFIEFLDILYYYWGLYLYKNRGLEIYKIIYKEKLERIKNNMIS